jgi:biopolymer transport protein TolQ
MFNKWRSFKKVEQQNADFSEYFRKSSKLSDVLTHAKGMADSTLAGVFTEGYNEIKDLLSRKKAGNPSAEKPPRLDDKDIEILTMTLERGTNDEISALERKVIFLATTANASPFLGLLGTVVGVMDSFWSIGERGSASLAVVAPGIAEALLATIVGLGAAIPAVIGYNWTNNKIKQFYDNTTNFTLEFLGRAKKDLT